MENASKALLLASAVLIGTMILSIGAYLFSIFGNTSKDINEQLANTKIDEFNSHFYKFEDRENCTAHDIVSIANLAKNYNKKINKDNDSGNQAKGITVVIQGINGVSEPNKFQNSSEKELQEFIQNYTFKPGTTDIQYFTCTDVKYDANSKLVSSITFKKNS